MGVVREYNSSDLSRQGSVYVEPMSPGDATVPLEYVHVVAEET